LLNFSNRKELKPVNSMLIKFFTKQVANILTFTGMILGLFAILNSIEGKYSVSALLICIAVFFDFFDGKIARKLHITSNFGKFLDSNSDLISFGVAPGILIYLSVLNQFHFWGILVSFLFISSGVFRLARYNANEFITHYVGLPITMAGGLIALSVFAISILPPIVYIIMVLVLSYLMASTHSFRKI
jgi:CDP-diacylglycerol--serine O-phosphatidyltransferase